MPIKTLPRRMTEVGRLRMGEKVPVLRDGKPVTKNGQPVTRPGRLDRWRITSTRHDLLDRAATLYGGQVQPWADAPGDIAQYELYTDDDTLGVLVPPRQTISQWYEHWSGGGCQRRCDGEQEHLGERACVCEPEIAEGAERLCKPTTRLNVVLDQVPTLGLWRLELHGYYGAVELAGIAALLEDLGATGRIIPALLRIDQRSIKRPGEPPKRFAVPVLEPHPDVLLAIARGPAAPQQAIAATVPAVEPPVVDLETGEVIQASPGRLGGDPTPAQPAGANPTPGQMRDAQAEATATHQRHDPTPPALAGVPTVTQVAACSSIGDAKTLYRWAGADYTQAVDEAIAYFHGGATRQQFSRTATLQQWREVLTMPIQPSAAAAPAPPGPAADQPPGVGGGAAAATTPGPLDELRGDEGGTDG